MTKKTHLNKRSYNNLNGHSDFDLDAYLEEQSDPDKISSNNENPPGQDKYRLKNSLLIIGLILTSVLWYYDWNPSNAWTSVFGNDEQAITTGQTGFAPEINGNIPRINIPPVPAIPRIPDFRSVDNPNPAVSLDISMTEYLSTLKDLGFLDNQVSTFSARQLYDANIPVSYLEELNEAGYLGDLSFVHITNYYQNEITVTYLDQLNETGFYDKLSFVDITNYYQQNVPVEYLKSMDDAGYLVDLSFVHVTNYYQAGVTPAFLDELKETGLYEDLNFLDVIDLYQRENGN